MTLQCFDGLSRRAVLDLRTAGELVFSELEAVPPPWLVERLGGPGLRDVLRSARVLLRQASSVTPAVIHYDRHRVSARCYDVALALRKAEDDVMASIAARHGTNVRRTRAAAGAMRRFFSFALITFALANENAAPLVPPSRPAQRRPVRPLSTRELEVLRLLADGHTVKEIAALKDISDKTVSTYRARLMRKLELRTTAALIRYAVAAEIGVAAAL